MEGEVLDQKWMQRGGPVAVLMAVSQVQGRSELQSGLPPPRCVKDLLLRSPNSRVERERVRAAMRALSGVSGSVGGRTMSRTAGTKPALRSLVAPRA